MPAFDFASECQAGPTDLIKVPCSLEPDVDVNAAVARRLRPAGEPQLIEKFVDGCSDVPGCLEVVAVGGVEIDAQLVGVGEIIRPGIPRVQVDAVHLRHPHDVPLVYRGEHLPRPRRRKGDVDQTGRILRAFDEERPVIDTLVPALEESRPVVDPAQCPGCAHDEMLDDIELRPPLLGEQHFVRTADPDLVATCLNAGLGRRHLIPLRFRA